MLDQVLELKVTEEDALGLGVVVAWESHSDDELLLEGEVLEISV